MENKRKKGLLGDVLPTGRGVLAERFMFPPFSVWNARDGHWQKRKKRWLSIGIESELGRKAGATFRCGVEGKVANTSVFDPVVCELVYRWFCPTGGQVVDPFAGGSVRGIVAANTGRKYWGCDLSEAQVAANRDQLNPRTVGECPKPVWVVGDAILRLPKAPFADIVFTCPPYGDLEVYSKSPKDLSNMERAVFVAAYREIIGRAAAKLKANRFAVFVVGNYRDKDGRLHDLVGDTVSAFADSGLVLYNDIVLLTRVASSAMRAEEIFTNGRRKVAKVHQNILVFYKGDLAMIPKGESIQ